jgi:hypothetical protein
LTRLGNDKRLDPLEFFLKAGDKIVAPVLEKDNKAEGKKEK